MNEISSTLMAHCGARKVTREELKEIPVPEGTKTHQPLSHYEITEVLEEALSFRFLKVVRDEYAISADGMKMFGVMDLNMEYSQCRFSIGLRNANDKSMRLALTAGYRVFVCDNMAFSGDFTPLFHKHTRNLDLKDSICIAVDRIQRGFGPMKERIEAMGRHLLTDNDAKLLIYEAFMERGIRGVPRALMPAVHDHYFHPEHKAFEMRNLWSLSNAFTSAFKSLAPVKQFEVTARLGAFLNDGGTAEKCASPKLPLAGESDVLDAKIIEKIREIDAEGAELKIDRMDSEEEISDEDDMADVVLNIDDYFDSGPNDDVMEEYAQRVAA